MIKMNPQAFSKLYGKDLIAFGTGIAGRRIIPYLAQDPDIRLHGVTNSRITVDNGGTFLDTGLPMRSTQAWADILPNATIFITAFCDIEPITAFCRDAGFQNFQIITGEMMDAFIKLEDQIAELELQKNFSSMCLANELHDAHKAAFSGFRACNRGNTIVVVGTGPTLQYYEPIREALHIGVNASLFKEDLQLDYYFLSHCVPEWLEKLRDYPCKKFFAVNRNINSADQIPEYILEDNGGRRFFSTLTLPGTGIHTNIECYPLMGFNSIIFPAIHFALYTHPKRLLLVGCDCALNGHFKESQQELSKATEQKPEEGTIQIPQWIDGYRKVKRFAAIHYPDTEIISVNPIGLRGMFRDVYTEDFLEANPDVGNPECEVLQPKDEMFMQQG